MTKNTEDESSLPQLWAAAESARTSLEASTLGARDPAYNTKLTNVIGQYQRIATLIATLALFSSNETLEDLTTGSMPYLRCSYRLGTLILRTPATTPAARKSALADARPHFEAFLHSLFSYGMLDEVPPLTSSETAAAGARSHAALYKSYIEEPMAFSMAGHAGDAAARRAAKMASFAAEQELQRRLAHIQQQPAWRKAAETAKNGDDGSGTVGGVGAVDEDVVREAYLAELRLCAHDTFNQLDGLNQEMDILKLAPDPDARLAAVAAVAGAADSRLASTSQGTAGTGGQANGGVAGDYSDRVDGPAIDFSRTNKAPLLTQQGKVLRPFTLVGTRQEVANGVFRPGHNLPTMSIDEYLEEERRRGNIIEGGGAASGIRPEVDEDDMEKVDAATYKARQWDEFVEANPKGAGNTMNRG